MIPLTFLYEEYIDRPKLSEQKNTFEYIVPLPTSGVGTKRKTQNFRNFIQPMFLQYFRKLSHQIHAPQLEQIKTLKIGFLF